MVGILQAQLFRIRKVPKVVQAATTLDGEKVESALEQRRDELSPIGVFARLTRSRVPESIEEGGHLSPLSRVGELSDENRSS